MLVCLHCVLQTSDAERIGVDQVAKIMPSGKASGTEQRELSPDAFHIYVFLHCLIRISSLSVAAP